MRRIFAVMAVFSVADAKAKFSELLDRAADGETIVISRHGVPIATLQAASKRAPIPYGSVKGRIVGDLTLPQEEIDAFYPPAAKPRIRRR